MSDNLNENKNPKNLDLINIKENNIRKDIIYFKEEILKEINQFEKKILNKNQDNNRNIDDKIVLIDSSINDLKNRFKELIKIVDTNKYLIEKIDKWNIFEKKISELLTSNKIKINILEKDLNDNIFQINRIINNSVIYPRIIGNNSTFKTFHEYIDYTLEQLSTTDSFRKKIELDLKDFKIKIDKIIQVLKIKVETSISAAHQMVLKGIKENENIIKEYINSKIFDIQVKYNELENMIEKDKNQLYKKIDNINNSINDKLEKEIAKIKDEKKLIYKDIDEYNKKYLKMKKDIQLQEKNKGLWLENNKIEIIEIIKNIIEEEKIIQNLNLNNKNICDSIQSSDLEYKKYSQKKEKRKNSKNKKYNNQSFDFKNDITNPLNKKIIENKSDSFIKTKNYLTNYHKSNNIEKNIEKNKLISNINNKNVKNINLLRKSARINKINNNNKSIAKSFRGEEEIINKNVIIIKGNINNKIKKNISRNNSNPNLIKFKTFTKDQKTKLYKTPLQSLLKLNLNLQDINAQFYSDIMKKSNSNEDWKKIIQVNDKNKSKNYFLFTSRNYFNNLNNEIFSYNNKKESKQYKTLSHLVNKNNKDKNLNFVPFNKFRK